LASSTVNYNHFTHYLVLRTKVGTEGGQDANPENSALHMEVIVGQKERGGLDEPASKIDRVFV